MEAYFTNNLNESMMKVERESEADNMILFTRDKQKITSLGGKTLGALLLETDRSCRTSAGSTTKAG